MCCFKEQRSTSPERSRPRWRSTVGERVGACDRFIWSHLSPTGEAAWQDRLLMLLLVAWAATWFGRVKLLVSLGPFRAGNYTTGAWDTGGTFWLQGRFSSDSNWNWTHKQILYCKVIVPAPESASVSPVRSLDLRFWSRPGSRHD